MSEVAPTGEITITAGATAEAASVKMEELKRDPVFMERVAKNDAEAFDLFNQLWRQSRGMSRTPQPPQHTGDVMEQMNGRELQLAQMHEEHLLDAGISPLGAYEYMNSRPIPPEEKEIHVRELKRLKSDKEFVRKYLDGNLEARDTMRRHTVGSVMRTGTIEEIRQWELAHYGKVIS